MAYESPLDPRLASRPAPSPGLLGGARGVIALILSILVAFLPSVAGTFFPPDAWYESLPKAPWNPPNYVFGPVWTILYLLSGVAAWMAWRRAGRITIHTFGAYALQVLFDGLWTFVFFGKHAPTLALLVNVGLICTLMIAMRQFRRVSTTSERLLWPKLVWLFYALSLNLFIVIALP